MIRVAARIRGAYLGVFMAGMFACAKPETREPTLATSGPAGSIEPVGGDAPIGRSGDALERPARGPKSPSHAQCSGRWSAKLDYDNSKTCSDAQLAPYLEVDVTLAAIEQGWTATLAKPAGFVLEKLDMSWDDAGDGKCNANIWFENQDVVLWLMLERNHGDQARARIDLQPEGEHCMGSGIQVDATFTPDAGGLPPISNERLALAGTYELELEWPKIDCAVQPPKTQRFEVTIDRTRGDRLVIAGLWDIGEDDVNAEGSNFYITQRTKLSPAADHIAQQDLALQVEGAKVSGKAEFSTPSPNIEDEDSCKHAHAKIHGKRTPPK